MPSIVSKVKDAIRGDNNSQDYRRSGNYETTDAERERYDSGHYDTSGNYGTGNQGTTEETGRYMGAGQMNPQSATSDTRHSSDVPGAFSSSGHDFVSDHHRDGREYVAPRGTAVEQGALGQSGYDRAEQAVTGRDTSGNYGQTSSSRGEVDDRDLMDPASRDAGSNVMGSTAGAGVGAGAYESASGHNKLHMKDDPRGYAEGEEELSHHHSKHHGGHGAHRKTVGGDPYEQQAGQGYTDDATSKSHGHRGAEAAAATAGVAGAGGLAASERRRHGETERDAYTGSNEPYRQGDMGGAGSHLASSTQSQDYAGNSKNAGVYNTVTGAGSGRDFDREATSGLGRSTGQTVGSAPSITSGSGATPREAGDSRLGAGTTALGAGAAGTGAAGLAHHHHNREMEREYERGDQRGYGLTSNQPGAASGYGTSGQPTTASSQPSGVSSSARGGMPGVVSAVGGGEHYGPGYPGSKVMHTCTRCGEDNDITHYFKKDIVYRISQ